MSKWLLLGTGFLQVFLVSINVYQISHRHYLGATIVGFLISLVWTLNVKQVAFGTWADRFIYATGAGLGTLCGLGLSYLLY